MLILIASCNHSTLVYDFVGLIRAQPIESVKIKSM